MICYAHFFKSFVIKVHKILIKSTNRDLQTLFLKSVSLLINSTTLTDFLETLELIFFVFNIEILTQRVIESYNK
jgi:hypothetical protein